MAACRAALSPSLSACPSSQRAPCALLMALWEPEAVLGPVGRKGGAWLAEPTLISHSSLAREEEVEEEEEEEEEVERDLELPRWG